MQYKAQFQHIRKHENNIPPNGNGKGYTYIHAVPMEFQQAKHGKQIDSVRFCLRNCYVGYRALQLGCSVAIENRAVMVVLLKHF